MGIVGLRWNMLELHWDAGKLHGKYYLGFRVRVYDLGLRV